MKKLLFLVLLMFLAISVESSAQDTTHTLIKLVKPQYLGLYVAPEYQYGQYNDAFTSAAGGSMMLLLNKKWGIGVTGQHSLSETFSPSGVKPLVLTTQFMGGRLEYTPHPDAAVHFTFPLVVGMGSASADSLRTEGGHKHYDSGFDGQGRDGNEYVVVQPGIQLEANLIRFVKLFGGVNYRLAFASGSSTTTLPKNTLQGISINVGLKIGLFDYHLGKRTKS